MIIRQAEIQKFGKLEKERIRKKYVDAVFESDDVWTGKESGQKNAGYI